MKPQALILLIIFLSASMNQAYCCGSVSELNPPMEDGKVELCEKHSCCSSETDTKNDRNDTNHETCKCFHLSVMNASTFGYFKEIISNNFDQNLPKADQSYSRLIYKEIFQPPKHS